ncbi:MAG: fimbrillin family protein [Alloprevotella sp.]|nr:fimbrillin family protein [Alloprevotella sp.]
MKKLFFATCATLMTFCGCTNDLAEEGFTDKTKALTFGAYTVKSRAYASGDVTIDKMKEDGSSFGVVGYSSNNLYLGQTTKAAAQAWKGATSSWEYVDPAELRFWPETNMDFYAYFPYSASAAAFTETNATGNVMTITTNGDANQDLLFAFAGNQAIQQRVPLTFHHAFSKIQAINISMPDDGTLAGANVEVEVQKVEVVGTATKGILKVDATGKASYADANTTRQLAFVPAQAINKTSGALALCTEQDDAYVFATNTDERNNVVGMGKTLWNGTKSALDGANLSTMGNMVYLKLTCKVKIGGTSTYYVGDDSNYGYVYIPMTSEDPGAITALEAGKRYVYNIAMRDNVGFKNDGDPILKPILFDVDEVEAWNEVTVNITL